MNIRNLTILILTLYSCISFSKDKVDNCAKLTEPDFTESFIELIPSKGLIIKNDTILLGKWTVEQLISRIDTSKVNLSLSINEPMGLGIRTMDGRPPRYTGTYQHTPDRYINCYSGNIKIDSIVFSFTFTHPGSDDMDKQMLIDSLTLSKIKVSKQKNVGLNTDLKIGDLYEQIFTYYQQATNINTSEMMPKRHSEDGVIFTIETDSIEADYFRRIKAIEINNFRK